MAALNVRNDSACGYSCQFVDAIPTDLLQTECSICLLIVRDPLMVDCCGYRFCRGCIEPLTSTGGKRCPLCNCTFTTAVPDKLLKRTLNQKRVYCAHKEAGCEWTGELAQFDKHFNAQPEKETERVEGCSYQKLKCIYCSAIFQRSLVKEHELECPERVLTCEFCNFYEGKRADVVRHWNLCYYFVVDCPNEGCDAKMKRMDVRKHIAEGCPCSVVPCEYSYAGCEVRLRRSDMNKHLDSGAKDHVSLLSEFCHKQQKEQKQVLENLQSRFENLQLEYDKQLKRDLQKELTELKKGIVSCTKCDSTCAILVSNLSDGTKEHMIKSLFGQHGRVDNIQYFCGNNMAIVEFGYSYSVDRVFEYEKSLAKGLRLRGSKLHCIRLS